MSKNIRRTIKQTERLIAQTSELEWKGYTQAKIAEKLGISQQMVSHYLRQIDAEVQQRLVPDRVVARQKQIDKVRSLMSTIWDDIDEDVAELRKHPENRFRVKAAIAVARRSVLQSLEVENKLLGLYEKYEPAFPSHCGVDTRAVFRVFLKLFLMALDGVP